MGVQANRRPILRERRNCWRKARARRLGYVIDAASFFKVFYEAALQAEKSIYIVGWDIDSRVELLVDQKPPVPAPTRLKEFLTYLCETRPELNVYVLSWDFNFIFSLEREAFPQLKFDWNGHPRLHYQLDSAHAALGSHHQKIVVIDDQLAFNGGLDITARRWDTPEHKGRDPRRIDPWGKTYGPFHDVQLTVQGPAAKALGDLVRERWLRATGESLSVPKSEKPIWPESQTVDLENIDVGISRTVPAMKGVRYVREVERLFTDSIARAEKFIYFEAQYFSSKSIARALARRLREPNGPEVLLVLARDATGWIEESTMSVLRQRVLELIRRADKHNRFRIFHPIVPGLDTGGYVKVHSKVTIIDDKFARVGSANLNQRSMGLDTECDIAFEALGNDQVVEAIRQLRTRLLSEHLDVKPEAFQQKFVETGSLLETVEFFRGKPRTLVELEREIPAWLDLVVPSSAAIDPSSPYRFKRGLRRYFPNFAAVMAGRVHWLGRFKIATLILILLALFVLWKFTPLANFIQPEKISEYFTMVRENPLGPLLIVLLYVVGGLVMVPVMALAVATALTFEPLQAFIITIIGAGLSAALTYWIGGKFKSEYITQLTNRWLARIKTKLAAGGWLAVAIVRFVPVAPFTVVNLVAGSIRVPVKDFAIGTLIGLLPGVTALTLLADRIGESIRSPNLTNLLWLALAILMLIAATRLIQYFAQRRVEQG